MVTRYKKNTTGVRRKITKFFSISRASVTYDALCKRKLRHKLLTSIER